MAKITVPKKEKETPCKKGSLFTKGYTPTRNRVECSNSNYLKSCYNCDWFYQAEGDKDEMCQNTEVLKYDMVITDNNIFCHKWTLSKRKVSVKSIYKKV